MSDNYDYRRDPDYLRVKAKFEEDNFVTHRNGIEWDKAPIPRRLHICTPWTSAYLENRTDGGRYWFYKCACGASAVVTPIKWMERNSRRRFLKQQPNARPSGSEHSRSAP